MSLRGAMKQSLRSWPRALPYVRPYKMLVAGSVVLMILAAVAALAEPWPVALLVDSVLGDKPLPFFFEKLVDDSTWARVALVASLGLIVALVIHGLALINQYLNTQLDMKMVLEFRSQLFQHVQRLSFAFHDERRTGEFMGRINGQASSVGSVVSAIFPLLQAALTLAGMFIVAFRLNAQVALLALTVVPFIYYATGYYGTRIGPEVRKVKGMEMRSLHIVHEAVQMLRVIVAFNREDHEYRKFREQGEEAVDARVKVTVKQMLFSLMVNVITAAGTAAVLGLGAYQVITNRLSVGELLVLIAYIAAVYAPLETISSTLTGLQENLIGFEMALELLETEPEIVEKPDAVALEHCRGRVTIDSVSFAYNEREHTLDDISLEARPGELVAIVGPTGAGKSTLMSLIPRFYDPAAGRILIDGVDLRDLTLASLRSHISIVLQEPLLFTGSIEENIGYGRLDATKADIVAAAKAANAHDFIQKLPRKYRTKLGERGAKLSGGERQRLAVARSFLKDAPILVLDEPTSSIDSRTEGVILDALERLMEGRTTFMIAHRLSTVRKASQIIVLDEGRIVQRGTHDQLIAEGGLYKQLHDLQNLPDEVARPLVQYAAAVQAEAAGNGSHNGAEGAPGDVAARATGLRGEALATVVTLLEKQQVPGGGTAKPEPAIAATAEATAGISVADAHRPSTEHVSRAVPARRQPRVIVLGMMTRMPVAGVVWQNLHYLLGFERLGYETWYVEANGINPSMFQADESDPGSAAAAAYIGRQLEPFGLGRQWAYQALHHDGAVYGTSAENLRELYSSADLIINLHGGTEPRPEHYESGRLVYLETDPVALQIELAEGRNSTAEFLEPHSAFFTFGESYGRPGCGLPVDRRFEFKPTRQPVLVDLWDDFPDPAGSFTTIGSFRQGWRDVTLDGETYSWSKNREWRKVLDLPARTEQRFEVALSKTREVDRRLLDDHHWIVGDAADLSVDASAYRRFIGGSLAEFTVAKDQNVRLRTGWFSDRSATYLAAGRAVVTQDTGFGNHLPIGEGLFAWRDLDEAADAVAQIAAAPAKQGRAAAAIAREHFEAERVLKQLLAEVGL